MNQQKRTLQVQEKLSAALSVSTPNPHSSMHVKLSLRDIQEPPGSLETQALAVGRRLPVCYRCCHFMTGDEAGAGEAKRSARTGSSPGRPAAVATPRTEA